MKGNSTERNVKKWIPVKKVRQKRSKLRKLGIWTIMNLRQHDDESCHMVKYVISHVTKGRYLNMWCGTWQKVKGHITNHVTMDGDVWCHWSRDNAEERALPRWPLPFRTRKGYNRIISNILIINLWRWSWNKITSQSMGWKAFIRQHTTGSTELTDPAMHHGLDRGFWRGVLIQFSS